MKKSTLEKCMEYEYKILEGQGISREECQVDNVYLTDTRRIHYVQINKVKPTKKNVLLMAHGFMGSNIGFYKMYKVLKDHFYIISIDLPGKGLSSSEKKEDLPKSCEDWKDYFVDNIKLFLDKLGLKGVNLLGHSMGAWVLTHFLKKYPDYCQKVFLLSPGGMHYENEQFSRRVQDFKESRPWYVKGIANSMVSRIFEKKQGPLDPWFVCGFKGYIAKKIYSGERLGISKENQKHFVPLYEKIFKSNPSSNKSLGYIFKVGPMSDLPLMPIFEEFQDKKQIVLYFGQSDWMDFELTQKLVRENKMNIKIKFIELCDHQIVFQNPEGGAEAVLSDFYFGEENEANGEADDGLFNQNPILNEYKDRFKMKKQKFQEVESFGGFERS